MGVAERSRFVGRSRAGEFAWGMQAAGALLLVVSLLPLVGPTVRGHSGDDIASPWLRNPVAVDGNVTGGEWGDAAEVDLSAVDPANAVPAFLYVKNDGAFLFVAYDAVGDAVADDNDHASIAFDTGHDAVATNGKEDQFFQSTPNNLFTMLEPPGNQAHFFYSNAIADWVADDNPYDPGLPAHAGLAGGIGFGRSARDPGMDHRTYEFRIPLGLLGLSAGDTVGFAGASARRQGVRDMASNLYSSWPRHFTAAPTFAEYGNLILASPPVDLTPVVGVWRPGGSAGEAYRVGDPVSVAWNATDDQPFPVDCVNITFGSGGTWTPINGGAYSHANDGTEVWDTNGVASGSYYVNVSAYDSAGQTTYARSNFTVSITTDQSPPEIRDVRLDGRASLSVPLGTASVEVNATIDDAGTGGNNVVAANFTLGVGNWSSSRALILVPGPGPAVNATGTLSLAGLASATYAIAVYARDAAGNANVTGATATLVVLAGSPPTVVSFAPSGTQVPVGANLVIVFSEAMDQGSVEAAIALSPAVPLAFSWSPDGRTLTIDPGQSLAQGTRYTLTIDASVAVDLQGGRLDGDADGTEGGDFVRSFTTEGGGDVLPWVVLVLILVAVVAVAVLWRRRAPREKGPGE